MSRVEIVFKNFDEILSFLNTVDKYDIAMDMKRGRCTVSAKSLLGIMNLGLNNVIELCVYDEGCEQLMQEISRYAAA